MDSFRQAKTAIEDDQYSDDRNGETRAIPRRHDELAYSMGR